MADQPSAESEEPSDIAAAIAEAKRRWPEKTHLRVAENETACVRGGDRSLAQVWGEYLTDNTNEVGCPSCKEWIHA